MRGCGKCLNGVSYFSEEDQTVPDLRIKELEIPGNEIARYLNVSGPAISKAVERGGDIIEKNEYKLIS